MEARKPMPSGRGTGWHRRDKTSAAASRARGRLGRFYSTIPRDIARSGIRRNELSWFKEDRFLSINECSRSQPAF